jgi:hypothetical protein
MEELIKELLTLVPVLGQMTHHESAAAAIQMLINVGMERVDQIAARTGQTREQVLADATATWAEAVQGAADLQALGHDRLVSEISEESGAE